MKKTLFMILATLTLPTTALAVTDEGTNDIAVATTTTEAAVTSDSTTTASEATAADSSTAGATTSDDAIKNDVSSVVADQLGDQAAATPFASMTAAELRDQLKNYADQSEVDEYTDQQLLDAQTAFTRFNHDITGMDMGAYLRTLRALYQDHTLVWELVEKALAFDPESYENFLDLIPILPQMQDYLQAMYPANSSFFAIRKLTDAELTTILQEIAADQAAAAKENTKLPAGIIALIATKAEKLAATTESSTTTSESSTTATETSSSKTAEDKKTDTEEDKKNGSLPKTGSQRSIGLAAAGVVLIGGVGFVAYRKRGKK